MDDHSAQIAKLRVLLNTAGWEVSEELIDEFHLRTWDVRGVNGEKSIVARSNGRLEERRAEASHAKLPIE